MHKTLTLTGEVQEDRTLTLTLPEGIPAGRVRVTVSIEPESEPRRRTPKEFFEAEFFGTGLGTELPETGRGFRDWNRQLEREQTV